MNDKEILEEMFLGAGSVVMISTRLLANQGMGFVITITRIQGLKQAHTAQ